MKCIRTFRSAESLGVPFDELETRPLTAPGRVIFILIYENHAEGLNLLQADVELRRGGTTVEKWKL
jgi:hypothetical protein